MTHYSFACASNPTNMASARLLRSYRVRANDGPDCTIRQAIQICLADQEHLPSVSLGHSSSPEEFINSIRRFSNPILICLREMPAAFLKFPGRKVACITSLGVGHSGTLSIAQSGPSLAEVERILQDNERDAELVRLQCRAFEHFFFRFNVQHGLETHDIPLGQVITHSQSYLAQQHISDTLDALLSVLSERPQVLSLDHLGMLLKYYASNNSHINFAASFTDNPTQGTMGAILAHMQTQIGS